MNLRVLGTTILSVVGFLVASVATAETLDKSVIDKVRAGLESPANGCARPLT